MAIVTLPSAALEYLMGPLTTTAGTDYDTLHLAQAAAFVGATDDQTEFYDGALAYYMLHYRTGDAQWATRGDFLAQGMADYQMDPAHLDVGIEPPRSNMAARDYATLGMAIHYLRTGYANSLAAVRAQGEGAARYYVPWIPNYGNGSPREGAYGMLAMLASTLLPGGPDYTALMAESLTNALADQGHDYTAGETQSPHQAWQSRDQTGGSVPALYCIENFMPGLFTESFILYDRVIGDARIVPMLKRYADWLWDTQWFPLAGGEAVTNGTSTTSNSIGTGSKTFTTQAGLSFAAGQTIHVWENSTAVTGMIGTVTSYSGTTLVINSTRAENSGTFTDWTLAPTGYPADQSAPGLGCIQYANIISGTVGTNSHEGYVCLSGLNLPVFGYLYAKGQGTIYKTRGDAIVAALPGGVYFLTKQFNQAFRSSPRYLGFVNGPIARVRPPRGAGRLKGV